MQTQQGPLRPALLGQEAPFALRAGLTYGRLVCNQLPVVRHVITIRACDAMFCMHSPPILLSADYLTRDQVCKELAVKTESQ
jgi:hypothetical protein